MGLHPSEIDLFRLLLADVAGEGVEIGCMDGFSSMVLLETSPKLRLTSIDPFVPDSMDTSLIGDQARCRRNLAPYGDRWRLIVESSAFVATTWPCLAPLDFIFIDGDHNYFTVLHDLVAWAPHLKRGGILAMHDARMNRGGPPFHPGPSRVANEFVCNLPEQWTILGEAFTLVVARKR